MIARHKSRHRTWPTLEDLRQTRTGIWQLFCVPQTTGRVRCVTEQGVGTRCCGSEKLCLKTLTFFNKLESKSGTLFAFFMANPQFKSAPNPRFFSPAFSFSFYYFIYVQYWMAMKERIRINRQSQLS